MRKALAILTIFLLHTAAASADWCRHSKDLATEMSLDGIQTIEVLAVSGDLEIIGSGGAVRVQANGQACIGRGEKDRLDEIAIVEERAGSTLRIIADVPFSDDNDGRIGGLDLELKIPDHLPVVVTDSSGGIEIENIYSLELTDSSGDVTIKGVTATVHVVSDSSGDLDIRDTGGVTIDVDSSGDIDVLRAASITIGKDSSGGIRARDIAGDATIGSDSSGSIEVANVAGNFSVRRDTSGSIDYRDVRGTVSVPDDD